jgi:hypothetical protein
MKQPASYLAASLALGLPFLAGATGARAEQPHAVVELFTSQGCSSCPPADQLFSQLAQDAKLVVLTMPVDYWDYLGWKDTLAQPAFSARQRNYAHMRGDTNVYTPQAVVSGESHVVGSDRAKIQASTSSTRLPLDVVIEEAPGSTTVRIGAANASALPNSSALPKAAVWLVPVARTATVAIARGENSGRSIAYSNVALGMVRLGDWSGQAASFKVTPEQLQAKVGTALADSFVILVQADGKKSGRMLGAARSRALVPPVT